ncbi:MAG: hypothetical protein Ct9H90mP6_06260 [Gammaproteobacteria bacterium]|nr:MAG: hypothetical protein Ct9H90mP6_06260 [Gammaproteobacteria bacterium]
MPQPIWGPSDVEEKYPTKPVDLKNKYNPFMTTHLRYLLLFKCLGLFSFQIHCFSI